MSRPLRLSMATPLIEGTATPGTASDAARADHKHPAAAFTTLTDGPGTYSGALPGDPVVVNSHSDGLVIAAFAPQDTGLDFTADLTTRVYECAGGVMFSPPQQITLPSAANVPSSWTYTFKLYGNGTGLAFVFDGSDTLDGSASYGLTTQYACLVISKSADQSGRPGWSIVSQYLS